MKTIPAHAATRRALAAATGALLTLSVLACGREAAAPEASTQPAPPATAGGDVYEVAGEIVRLPAANDPEVWIRHEAVPGLKDAGGKVIGMEAMTMPFKVGREASLDGFQAGSRIRFRLHVDWEAESAVWIDEVRALPPDVALPWEEPAGESREADAPPQAPVNAK